jgi:ClpP class serine protease
MPTWGEILEEYQESARQRNGQPDGDGIRLKYLKRLHHATGRAVIVYASGWLNYRGASQGLSVEGSDVHAMMECCHGIEERKLDLILHSPGGRSAGRARARAHSCTTSAAARSRCTRPRRSSSRCSPG